MSDIYIDFKKEICSVINKSELPISAKYYILGDVMREVTSAFNAYSNYIREAEKNTQTEGE